MTRRFQFSLRALLVATTAAAVVLGVYMNRVHRQRRFAAAIESIGGEFAYDDEVDSRGAWAFGKKPRRGWLRRLVGDDFFDSITSVYVYGISDDDLVIFGDAPTLRNLEIVSGEITDEGVARLSQLKRLERLTLRSNRITIQGLTPLARMKGLKYLVVMDNGFTDAVEVEKLIRLMPQCWIFFEPYSWDDLSRDGSADDDGESDASPQRPH